MQYQSQEADNKDPEQWSEFKKSEKKYKKFDKKSTDLSGVIDLNKYDANMESICQKSTITDPKTNKSYESFKFFFPEGLYVVKNFMSIEEQIYQSQKCVNEYFKKP